MRAFNYSEIRNKKLDSDILGLIASIYKKSGKQELYLKQQPEKLEKLVEISLSNSSAFSFLAIVLSVIFVSSLNAFL